MHIVKDQSCNAAPVASVGRADDIINNRINNVGERLALTRLLFTGATVVLGGSFHFGYQISLINPLADVLQAFIEKGLRDDAGSAPSLLAEESALRDALWASVAGILFAGALIGAVSAPLLLENIGAKRSLLLSSLILCGSFALAAISRFFNTPFVFILARFISGIGIGMITTVQTVYLTEISPVRHRGLMGTLTGFATSVGFVIASGVGMPQALGTKDYWHYAYILEAFPSILLAVALLTLLEESPNYSMRQGQTDAALRCIRLYHRDESESKARAVEIRAETIATNCESELTASKCYEAISKAPDGSSMSFAKILKTRSSRNALLICVLLNVTVSFSGILAVSFFGTFLLQEIGFSDRSAALANCIASFSGILGNFAGSFAIDRIGRRKLIIGGLCTLATLNIALMMLVFAFQYSTNVSLGYGFLGVFMLFLFAFSCGVGPMAWFLATELSVSAARSRIQSASVACQYATCFLSPLIFFPLYQRGGGASFLVFIVPLAFTAAYLYALLPETRDRAINTIVAMLDSSSSLVMTTQALDTSINSGESVVNNQKLPSKAKRKSSAIIYTTQSSLDAESPSSPSLTAAKRRIWQFRHLIARKCT